MNPDQPPSNGAPPTIGAAFRLAGRFLLPLDPAVDAQHPSWTRAAVWLPVWGLLIGVVYAASFRVTWLWLGEYQRMRLAPMVILLAFDVGFFGYRLLDGAARLLAMRPGRASIEPQPASLPTALVPVVVLVVLAVLGKFALLAALPAGAVPYPADWREHLHTLYPYVIFRPLILMPLWGRWGILLASSIGRVSPAAATRMGRLAEGNSLTIVLLYWAAATAVVSAVGAARPMSSEARIISRRAMNRGSSPASIIRAR